MAPIGFIAIVTGWFTAEIGRQPWAIYGVLRTSDAVAMVSMHDVLISFILMVIVYGIIFGFFYFYFLDKTIKKGPVALDTGLMNLDSAEPFQFMRGNGYEAAIKVEADAAAEAKTEYHHENN